MIQKIHDRVNIYQELIQQSIVILNFARILLLFVLPSYTAIQIFYCIYRMINYNNIVAEFLGTVLLVLSVFASGGNPAFIGFTLAIIIYFGGKNPGHVNPAITLAMYFKKKINSTEFGAFISAQLLGALTSLYLYNALA